MQHERAYPRGLEYAKEEIPPRSKSKYDDYSQIPLKSLKNFCNSKIQWLPEQMECGNLQIGKPAVALWIPMTQKLLIPHLKALNVGFNLKSQTIQKL